MSTPARKPTSRPVFVRLAALCIIANLLDVACRGCGCETCEDSMYDSAYVSEREREVERFEYEASAADTWKELVTLLGGQGFTLSPVVVEDTDVFSDWVTKSSSPDRERIVVRLKRRSPKHFQVDLRHEHERHEDGVVLQTDPPDMDLEWQLLQRVEPSRAKKIQDDADVAGKRAGAVGRGCDRGCETGCRTCINCMDTCDRCDRAVKRVVPP